jgi:hypothetical protein
MHFKPREEATVHSVASADRHHERLMMMNQSTEYIVVAWKINLHLKIYIYFTEPASGLPKTTIDNQIFKKIFDISWPLKRLLFPAQQNGCEEKPKINKRGERI